MLAKNAQVFRVLYLYDTGTRSITGRETHHSIVYEYRYARISLCRVHLYNTRTRLITGGETYHSIVDEHRYARISLLRVHLYDTGTRLMTGGETHRLIVDEYRSGMLVSRLRSVLIRYRNPSNNRRGNKSLYSRRRQVFWEVPYL